MNNQRLTAQFQALADDTRLQILALVVNAAPSATELNQALAMSQPRVAHHLKVLVDAGFLKARRDGRFVRYTLPGSGFELTLTQLVLTQLRKSESRLPEVPVPTGLVAAVKLPVSETKPAAPTAEVAPRAEAAPEDEDDRRPEMEDFLL